MSWSAFDLNDSNETASEGRSNLIDTAETEEDEEDTTRMNNKKKKESVLE